MSGFDKIGIVGLGYVGLPLYLALSKHYEIIGYDIDNQRVVSVQKELEKKEIYYSQVFSKKSKVTCLVSEISDCDLYIVTVPTPVDKKNNPDFSILISACQTVGKLLNKGDVVILESTVSPGTTEEICLPIFIKESNLSYNLDFFIGYSPERVSPGDDNFSLSSMKKLVSVSDVSILDKVCSVYSNVTSAGVVPVSSIKVAETSKMIENVQRDVNLALINELSNICRKLGISSSEVIEAASTKSNFMKVFPGLVGGHCVAVDPYYWIQKSVKIGHKAELAALARDINEKQVKIVSAEIATRLNQNNNEINQKKILILGFTFKENCDDVRNTMINNLYRDLLERGFNVDIYDPVAEPNQVKNFYKIEIYEEFPEGKYNAIVLAVAHDLFSDSASKISALRKQGAIVFDLKNYLDEDLQDWVM